MLTTDGRVRILILPRIFFLSLCAVVHCIPEERTGPTYMYNFLAWLSSVLVKHPINASTYLDLWFHIGPQKYKKN